MISFFGLIMIKVGARLEGDVQPVFICGITSLFFIQSSSMWCFFQKNGEDLRVEESSKCKIILQTYTPFNL